jgi:hypothetical protein
MSQIRPQRSEDDGANQGGGRLHKGFEETARRVEQRHGVSCTPRYIKAEKEAGRLGYTKFANALYFSDDDIDQWFDSLRRTASQTRQVSA